MFDKKRGFTLIEMLVVVAIIVISSTSITFQLNNVFKNKAIQSMQTKIPRFFSNACSTSKSSGERLYFTLDFENGVMITFRDEERDESSQKDKLELSKLLDYRIVSTTGNDNTVSNKNFYRTTETGNMNQGFSLYLFKKNENIPQLRIAISTTSNLQYAQINLYEPKDNICYTSYHNTNRWEWVRDF